MDDSDSDGQRRIELHSPKDLAYLIANVRAAAAEHLHAAFPQSGGEDELRNAIEAIVDDYIDKTFTLAAPNLTINGLSVTPSDFLKPESSSSSKSGRKSSIPPIAHDRNVIYEPFDTYKRQQVAGLVTQEEELLEQVAAMKRAVPADVAAKMTAQLDRAAARDEEQLQRTLDSVTRVAKGGVASTATGAAAAGMVSSVATKPPTMEIIPQLERQDDVEERFRVAVGALGRLKRDMPSVVAKMERARVAGEYVRDDR